MELPKALVINGERWTVRKKHMAQYRGLCIHKVNEILIDKGLPEHEVAEVFLHELLHACLPEQHWTEKEEEQMVERLAPRLLATLEGLGWVP